MTVDVFTLVGLAGVAGYVASYALLQLGMLDGNGVMYSVANVVAASLVLVSLVGDFNLASAVIQVVWIVAGIVGLLLRVARCRSLAAGTHVLENRTFAESVARVPRIDTRAAFRSAEQTTAPTRRLRLIELSDVS